MSKPFVTRSTLGTRTYCPRRTRSNLRIQAYCARSPLFQLLEEDSHTLTDMDSGAMQVVDPPDWDDLSSLLQNISPDEWAEVLKDVEESSSFDLEALLPPEDLVHDMSSDEGIDLLYDLVT